MRRLVQLFEDADWPRAPRFLGFGELGREMRTYLKGHAAWEDENPAAVRSRGSLRKVGQLVCEFHDITVGTDLAGKHATRDRDEAITKALGGFMRQVRSEPAGDASCQA